jgi:hypothetical protein
MAAYLPKFRTAILILLGCALICVSTRAQTGADTSPPAQPAASPAQPANGGAQTELSGGKPLPDIVTIMHDVEINQRKSETIEKDYLYHSVQTEQEVDGHGQVKKTTVTEFDHYWVDGVPVRRLVKKNGKALTADEIAREDERIGKIAAKAREKREKADDKGRETDSRGNDEVTVSRLLELGAFTNARRVQLNGRDTIAVDYTGDPNAKTRNRAEDVIRDMVGTAWIDEQDHVLARVEGHFANAFKIGGGLIANIQKDTRFSMVQTKVNDEVWLPARFEGQGAARAMLFFSFNGSGQIVNSDYRKFRATSTILPGVTQVDTNKNPNGPAQP